VTRSRRSSLIVAFVALGVAVLAAAGVLLVGASRHSGTTSTGGAAASRGEAIFLAGLGADGRPIPRRVEGNGGGMMGGGMLTRGGCATCHGSDGRGRSTMMFTAPDITYGNLTDPAGMLMPDGTREPAFTDEALRTAVTRGIDPEGDRLEWPMPRWHLTGPEWTDLLAYLKTLR